MGFKKNAAGAGLAGLIVVGCTLTSELGTTQCRSQADCLARGPEFADTTCTEARVCVKIEAVTASCKTNAECIDRNAGAAYTCRRSDSKCVPLTTPNCSTVLAEKDDLLSDDVLFIGAMAPLNDDGRMAQFGMAHARQEIKRQGHLAAATPDGPRRPLAIISCLGEDRSPAVAQTQVDHLTKTVQVPWVIGPISPQRMAQVVTQTVATDILNVTSSSIGFISDLADKDLIFRAGYNEDQFVKVIAPFFETVITQQVEAEGMKLAGEPLRVALLRSADNAGLGFADAIQKSLVINGKLATDADNAANFKLIDLGDQFNPVNHPNPDAERNLAIAQTISFKPHVAIIAATPSPFNAAWLALNRSWPVANGPKPFTISIAQAVPGNIVNAATQLNNEEARRKYYGIRSFSPDYNPDDLGLFGQGLRLAFADATSPPTSNTYNFYDSVYLFAYAVAAIGNAPVRGPELARGLRKVGTLGEVIPWGPTNYSKGLQTLQKGGNIQYFGVGGSYVFDAKGDHPLTSEMVCMTAKAGRPSAAVSSGWKYDFATNTASGAPNCPNVP